MKKEVKGVEQPLVKELKESYKASKQAIKARLNEFKTLSEDNYLKELLFCILTPQSNAKKCWQAVEQLQNLKNSDNKSTMQISEILKSKTRFHNNKAGYVREARDKWRNIIKLINNSAKPVQQIRNELADNNLPSKVRGIGLKEASHFLRNIGKSGNQIAILDRHILRNMKRLGIIKEDKIKNTSDYLAKEQLFINLANKLRIPADELDLLLWARENGGIFK